jgi:hypothetical protein
MGYIHNDWILIILFRIFITKYVQCAHTSFPFRSPIHLSIFVALHSFILAYIAHSHTLILIRSPPYPKNFYIFIQLQQGLALVNGPKMPNGFERFSSFCTR